MSTVEMIQVEWFIETSKVGSRCSDVFEIEKRQWDAMSKEEKEEEVKEWAFQNIEWGWRVSE